MCGIAIERETSIETGRSQKAGGGGGGGGGGGRFSLLRYYVRATSELLTLHELRLMTILFYLFFLRRSADTLRISRQLWM